MALKINDIPYFAANVAYSINDHGDEVGNVQYGAHHASGRSTVNRGLSMTLKAKPNNITYLVVDLLIAVTNGHALRDVRGQLPVREGRVVHFKRLE